ncbi:MAG: GHMP family kinase ATP-binding protein [Candidatus Aminicenantales bacterium]
MANQVRLIHSSAPLRINDIGGWTDTWFAGEGWVLNLAIAPPVEVQVKVRPNRKSRQKNVLIHAENFNVSFRVDPAHPTSSPHPLLQYIIARVPPSPDLELEINLFSPVPAGISTGTSASVSVALLGALLYLGEKRFLRRQVVSLAHRVETEDLGMQSGIQDQVAAAYGGICFIHMPEYPRACVEKVSLKPGIWAELGRRLCLVYLGRPHRSSVLHERVISGLERGGSKREILEALKKLPARARAHLTAGDLESYGKVMIENNEYQRALLAELISNEADEIIHIAKRHGAAGWKVNGAGGKGGTLTILASADDERRRKMVREIVSLGKGMRLLPTFLSSVGLRVGEVILPDE